MSKAPEKTVKVNINSHGFEGHVEMVVRPYVERLKMAQKLSKGDETDAAEVIGLVDSHVKSVELEFVETKEKFDCLEDVSFYAEGALLINDLARIVTEGPKLGKS